VGEGTQKLRLDQILLREGLVSEDQLKEALMRQKAQGGKVGSQLLYHRYLTEADLVKVLAKQFGCEGVVLASLDVPEMILKFLPAKVAIARKVLPFDYNPETNELKIACEDPTDQDLINELNFVARGKQVKLYVAAEIALRTSIARLYQGKKITLEEMLALEIPNEATDTGRIPVWDPDTGDTGSVRITGKGHILLVTDEEFSGPLLKSLLERDEYQVTITDSADDAIDLIGDTRFHTVFIKDTVSGDYIDLIDRVRKISPGTVVRYYESSSSLILHEDAVSTERELLLQNLELFTSLLSTRSNMEVNHSGTVGEYVDRLCQKLKIPEKERLMIANAGYLHDLAKFYYQTDESQDYRAVINLTIKLLTSLNYSPVAIEMLRSMYINLGGKYRKRLPIEVLGGNILTIVDLFCDNVPLDQRLSLDKFDAIKRKFRDLAGKLFLTEVVEAFIGMIQDDILKVHASDKFGQIMLFGNVQQKLGSVDMRLKNEGYNVICESSPDALVDLYLRSQPDMLVLMLDGPPDSIVEFVDRLARDNINFRNVPTFLLVPNAATSRLTELFERGIEDIIAHDVNIDFLLIKMQKIRAQAEEQARVQRQTIENQSGSRGRLSDMNLIDLLQALGPSRKTAKLTLTDKDRTGELIMFLARGQIHYARCGEKTGPEAVYDAISWSHGHWLVEPVATDELPEPNNELSNESILMEGCRLLDEARRENEQTAQ
jgi:response regulator RpfG family c-di-GMP phosphodiesterase